MKMTLPDILEVRTDEEDQLRPAAGSQSPVAPDPGLQKVDTCLEAAAFSLKFDIAELWRFGPDTTKRRGSGKARNGSALGISGAGGGAKHNMPLKPSCEHVYTMPATLKTYTGRIMGMWNSGFDDSRAPQHHVLSPQVRFGYRNEKEGHRALPFECCDEIHECEYRVPQTLQLLLCVAFFRLLALLLLLLLLQLVLLLRLLLSNPPPPVSSHGR